MAGLSALSGRKRGMGRGLVGRMAREQESGLRGDTRGKCGFPCDPHGQHLGQGGHSVYLRGGGVGDAGMGMRGRKSYFCVTLGKASPTRELSVCSGSRKLGHCKGFL